MIRRFVLSGLIALASVGASAQTTLHYREGQRVDPEEVRQILEKAPDAAGTTRSIRLLASRPESGGASQPAKTPDALSLPVRFEFDSAKITSSARGQLDALAEGIKLLPPDRAVVIEGHTDARGSAPYNDGLSARRAEAVKSYLVETHGIAAQRLQAVGVGKQQPIEGSDPYAGENRRVQFRGG
ncbi:MAG TPA: OmpA family protein [Burkholderiaceae bacterium]|nr:OmpA family protein [Burkholderiaceae bacterium]